MAPPNGVPPSSDTDNYSNNVTATNNSDTQENNANENEETKTVACENCKQNQKEEMALNGEPPNNNIIQKNQNNEDRDINRNGQVKKLEPKKKIEQMDVEEEAELIVPPDGGWGWVVAFASFMCNMVVDGITFSFGMFLPHITATYGVSKAKVALVGSLLSGFYLLVGPFVSALANRYGFRLVAILGSCLGAAAFVISYFADSVEFLYITYGIMGGIGFGLIYVPAVIAVGFYFEKWRALATGIAVCGSGIGTFVLAPIFSSLIDSLGWQKTFLVQAAMTICCIAFGVLFRPLKPTKVSIKTVEGELEEKEPETNDPLMLKAQSSTSIHKMQSTHHYPTVMEQISKSITSLNKSTYSLHKRHSVHPITEENSEPLIESGLQPVIVPARRNSLRTPSRPRTTSESEGGMRSRRGTLSGADTARPMYRDDIFFGGSLARLPQYTSHTSIGYTMSVTRLPTQNDIDEENSNTCKLCPESVKRTLSNMLDVSLLQSPSFVLLALSGGFTMMGFYVPFMYLTDRALENGMPESRAMWLVSTIGICNTIGRVACGLLSSHPKANTLWINNIAISLGGIVTLCSGFSNSDWYQFLYCCVFGLSISCFASLRSILLVDLVGLEKLTNAFGISLLFQGIAATVGSPMAGAFYDATGSYNASFYLSGSLILFSGIMCYPLRAIKNWELRRQKDCPV